MPGIDQQARLALAKRAELLQQIRSFFASADVMEVDPPVLGRYGVTDVHIDCIPAAVAGTTGYLPSSPEFFMKRLLAAGSGAIYYLGKVFRSEELGRRHRPEFTMIEWYRPGWDEVQLIDEVAALCETLNPAWGQGVTLCYGEVFEATLGLNPHRASAAELAASAAVHCGGDWREEPVSTLLDLLFSTQVEPRLPSGLVFIRDYPQCQSALARLDTNADGECIARRFEVFIDRMEVGNGYFELTDAAEQAARFAADRAARQDAGRRAMAADTRLLAALEQGLPACAGVAVGFDRLLMQLLKAPTIAQVMPFGDEWEERQASDASWHPFNP